MDLLTARVNHRLGAAEVLHAEAGRRGAVSDRVVCREIIPVNRAVGKGNPWHRALARLRTALLCSRLLGGCCCGGLH